MSDRYYEMKRQLEDELSEVKLKFEEAKEYINQKKFYSDNEEDSDVLSSVSSYKDEPL
jgi:spore coat protein CotF